jgi:hypothetical protein
MICACGIIHILQKYQFFAKLVINLFFQVHSLTARSVSKQFREGLKLAHPNQTDINIKLKSQSANGDASGNGKKGGSDSDDSLSPSASSSKRNSFASTESINSTGSNNLGNGLSSDNNKPSSRKNHILARAEFWDKRVKEKIIDDDRIIKEFPKMT